MAQETRDQIKHLFRRAGFGPSPAELDGALHGGLDNAIRDLLSGDAAQDASRFEYPGSVAYNTDYLAGAWLEHLVRSTKPLHEKMVLFWHNHFATAYSKVQDPLMMYHQNVLFRQNALGNFRDLLHGVATNPAMLIWLDGILNFKESPNENFAREVMELFSLGPDNYTETDVHQSGRAFTGWGLATTKIFDFVRYEEIFQFDVNEHDFGLKTFLGKQGHLDGHQVIEVILQQPAAPTFLAGKLLNYFVTPNPDPALVDRVAGVLVRNDWEVRPAVQFILESDEFWSPAARYALIKSPVEYVVGFAKQLEIANPPGTTLARFTRLMGQELFNPPSVKGWTGGRQWLNSFTYLMRFNFASAMLQRRQSLDDYHLAQPLVENHATSSDAVVDWYLDLLGPLALTGSERDVLLSYLQGNKGPEAFLLLNYATIDSKVRGLIQLIAATPYYHMS